VDALHPNGSSFGAMRNASGWFYQSYPEISLLQPVKFQTYGQTDLKFDIKQI